MALGLRNGYVVMRLKKSSLLVDQYSRSQTTKTVSGLNGATRVKVKT